MITVNNIKVPESWDEVEYGKYLYLCNYDFSKTKEGSSVDSFDYHLILLSMVLGVSESELMKLPFVDYSRIQNTLKFIETTPVRKPSKRFKFIPLKEISMDKWVAYERLKTDFTNNSPAILSMFLQDEHKIEAGKIRELPTSEVLDGFFTLQRNCHLSMKRSHLSLVWHLMKIRVKMMMSRRYKKKMLPQL